MNAEIKAEWIAALRSGEYEQGKNYLHTKADGQDRFCCLGVLCELAVKTGVVQVQPLDDGTFVYQGAEETYGKSQDLPLSVQKWAGLDDESGSYGEDEELGRSLIAHNDSLEDDFSAIADVIEQHF